MPPMPVTTTVGSRQSAGGDCGDGDDGGGGDGEGNGGRGGSGTLHHTELYLLVELVKSFKQSDTQSSRPPAFRA